MCHTPPSTRPRPGGRNPSRQPRYLESQTIHHTESTELRTGIWNEVPASHPTKCKPLHHQTDPLPPCPLRALRTWVTTPGRQGPLTTSGRTGGPEPSGTRRGGETEPDSGSSPGGSRGVVPSDRDGHRDTDCREGRKIEGESPGTRGRGSSDTSEVVNRVHRNPRGLTCLLPCHGKISTPEPPESR